MIFIIQCLKKNRSAFFLLIFQYFVIMTVGCSFPQSYIVIGLDCKVPLDIDCKQKQEQVHESVCKKISNELTQEV